MQALDGMGRDGAQGNDGHSQGNLKHDITQFMHTLFRALKNEASSFGDAGDRIARTGEWPASAAVAPAATAGLRRGDHRLEPDRSATRST